MLFEVVNINITAFWDVTSQSLADSDWHLSGTCCLPLQGRLRMEAEGSSQLLVTFTRLHTAKVIAVVSFSSFCCLWYHDPLKCEMRHAILGLVNASDRLGEVELYYRSQFWEDRCVWQIELFCLLFCVRYNYESYHLFP